MCLASLTASLYPIRNDTSVPAVLSTASRMSGESWLRYWLAMINERAYFLASERMSVMLSVV